MTRGRGRPPGRTPKGEQTQTMLYDVAVRLFAQRGYEKTTLGAIATEAGVSRGLLYKYFPSKSAVVMALYLHLSRQFDERASCIASGAWIQRVDATLVLSLDVLRPHRDTLKAVMSVMLADPELGLFSPRGTEGRTLVQTRFLLAVSQADNAPQPELTRVLGRLFDAMQLGVILWWLLDRSEDQRATDGLIVLLRSLGTAATAALWIPGVVQTLTELDRLVGVALYGENTCYDANGSRVTLAPGTL